MKTIERYSIGTDDRFGCQGAAQIAAFRKAREKGVDYVVDIAAFFKEFEADVRVAALRHVQADKRFDPGMRQLVHVAFRVAAAMGGRYLEAFDRHKAAVSRNVTANLWEWHLVSLFIG